MALGKGLSTPGPRTAWQLSVPLLKHGLRNASRCYVYRELVDFPQDFYRTALAETADAAEETIPGHCALLKRDGGLCLRPAGLHNREWAILTY